MKRFMAVYTGTKDGAKAKEWASLDENTRNTRTQEGMKAWHQWVEKNKSHIVDGGAPLGRTKRIDAKGVSDYVNQLTAFTVVEAASHDEAAKYFLGHPHFTIFPGDHVEIMECLPIPGKA